MNKYSSCFCDEKSNLENFSNNISEGLPLDESFDSERDSKSNAANNKTKKNKFVTMTKKKKSKLTGIRKRKEDNIRKKIKTSALNNIIKTINKKLTKAGSIYTFKALPQHFIADISRKTNHEVMHLTFKELLEYTYKKLINDENYDTKKYNKTLIEAAKEKYKKNCQTLEYLDSIQETHLKSVWEQTRNTEYVDLLRNFFQSKEYKKSLEELKEDKYYIESYKYFAETFVEFFLNYEPIKKTNKKVHKPNDNSNLEQNNDTPNPDPNNINDNVTPTPESNTLPNQDLEININDETPNQASNNLNNNDTPNPEFNPFIFNMDFQNFSYNDMQLPFLVSQDIDLLESFNSLSDESMSGENRFLTIF